MKTNCLYNVFRIQDYNEYFQESLWRTNLLSGHFDHWTRQGFEFDETIKAEALKPAQEALMKLFAVSHYY
jgi:hypothetical protein